MNSFKTAALPNDFAFWGVFGVSLSVEFALQVLAIEEGAWVIVAALCFLIAKKTIDKIFDLHVVNQFQILIKRYRIELSINERRFKSNFSFLQSDELLDSCNRDIHRRFGKSW
jgi:hypothetical protein